jgi:putative oxidoreductase
MKELIKTTLSRLESVPMWVNGLVCRWGIAGVFWRSGQTKVHGFFEINPSTYDLFKDEYKVPLVPTDIAAVAATISEHLFSALLVIGLASRLSAGALFGMTMVIEIFVYPDSWPDHLMWSAAMLFVIFRGPGELSLDHLIKKRSFRPDDQLMS